MARQNIIFENFDIRIGPQKDGKYPLEVIYSPVGETESSVWQTFPTDDDFQDLDGYLRDLIAEAADASEFGSKLYQFLFLKIWGFYGKKSFGCIG